MLLGACTWVIFGWLPPFKVIDILFWSSVTHEPLCARYWAWSRKHHEGTVVGTPRPHKRPEGKGKHDINMLNCLLHCSIGHR